MDSGTMGVEFMTKLSMSAALRAVRKHKLASPTCRFRDILVK